MSNPLVSVIVPNFNYARYLTERMDSILNQTYQNIEIIILDDASTDNSREVIERYRSNPRVSHIVYNDANSGSPFRQWERGIPLAKGEYVWIAEADDFAEPQFLEYAVAALESDRKVVLAMSMSRTIDAQGCDTGQCRYDDCNPTGETHIYNGKEFIERKLMVYNRCYNASAIVFRRSAWEKMPVKDYLHMYYLGDWLFWMLIARQGNVAIVQRNLSKFRFHGSSTTDSSVARPKVVTAETWKILYYGYSRMKKIPAPIRWKFIYGVLRTMRREKLQWTVPSRKVLSKDFMRFVNYENRRYPLYWAYKHLFMAAHSKVRRCHLRPLRTLA